MKSAGKRIALVVLGLVLLGALVLALRPGRVPVELAPVVQGPLRVTVEGTGQTRYRDRHTVAAPVSGHCRQVQVRVGQKIAADTEVAVIEPGAPAILDARTKRQLRAQLQAARSLRAEAKAAVGRAQLAYQWALTDLGRKQKLADSGALSQQALDSATFQTNAQKQQVQAAVLAAQTATSQVRIARAALAQEGRVRKDGVNGSVKSAVGGYVLHVYQQSEGPVSVGTPLIEVGDPRSMEVVVELLTTDAVQVKTGANVDIVGWGGDAVLHGLVRLVEPAARTQVSALGVKEQRVNVIVDPKPGESGWSRLGHGFFLEARVTIWSSSKVVKIPSGAVISGAAQWSVFVVDDQRAQLRQISVGQRNDQEVQILSGLRPGERVILYPSSNVESAVAVLVLK